MNKITVMNKLGKVLFRSTVLVKFHECSERNFRSLKQLSITISTCYNRLDALSHVEWRVVSSAHMEILHRASSNHGDNRFRKKRDGPR